MVRNCTWLQISKKDRNPKMAEDHEILDQSGTEEIKMMNGNANHNGTNNLYGYLCSLGD